MSRALSKKAKKALKSTNSQIENLQIFRSIYLALAVRHSKPLEIELLGDSHELPPRTYLLQDGNALAIPKLFLLRAFIAARMMLNHYHERQAPAAEDEVALHATAVILLFDPEHLTAANTRKRAMLQEESLGADTEEILDSEFYFVDSLLTSRLHRHTKSPTLWAHREWLLRKSRKAQIYIDVVRDLTEVIFVSAERHPRNYYAWSHARYLIELLCQTQDKQEQTMIRIVEKVKKWCFSHHNDISGWSFLMRLLALAPGLGPAIFAETLQLAESFRWRNEAAWIFLREVVHCEWMQDSQRQDFEKLRVFLLSGAKSGSQDKRNLEQAGSWVAA